MIFRTHIMTLENCVSDHQYVCHAILIKHERAVNINGGHHPSIKLQEQLLGSDVQRKTKIQEKLNFLLENHNPRQNDQEKAIKPVESYYRCIYQLKPVVILSSRYVTYDN